MVKGSQRRILQVLIFSTLPNPQTTILHHIDPYQWSFSWIPHLPTFCSCGLVVNGTVDDKDNREKNTREVTDIRKHHFSCNFIQPGCYMLW